MTNHLLHGILRYTKSARRKCYGYGTSPTRTAPASASPCSHAHKVLPALRGSARARSKWAALLLCIFLGAIGAHKFYEGKAVVGVICLFTLGLFGIGVFIDFLCLLFKPNPYYI